MGYERTLLVISGWREVDDPKRSWSSRRQLVRDSGFVSSGHSHRNRFQAGWIAHFDDSFIYADIRIAQALREARAWLRFDVLRLKIGATYRGHRIRSLDFESTQVPVAILTRDRSLPLKSSIVEPAALVNVGSINTELASESMSSPPSINPIVTVDCGEVSSLSPARIGIAGVAAIERPFH